MLSKLLLVGILSFSILHAGGAQKENPYEFHGEHYLASYFDCDQSAITDVHALKAALLQAAGKSGATILESVDHVFPPNGFTMVILLSESHASIHTYPEHRACFVDLFTCGSHCSYKKFDEALKQYLKPGRVSQKILERHQAIEEKNAL